MLNTKTIKLSNEILNLLSELDAFRSTWASSGLITPELLAVLRHTATVESIGSSTRIEGSRLSDREVDDLLFHAPVKPFDTRDAQEVAGYAATLDAIAHHWKSIPLTEKTVKELHRDLLHFSKKDKKHRGEYKRRTNHVEAFGVDGKSLGIIFKTAEPKDTPRLMKELFSWTDEAFSKRDIHPLLAIGVFVIVFLEIHPFQDGHGRLSRLLTTLLLLRHGYSYVAFSSLENIIERSKKDYYDALRKTQKTIRSPKPDWQPWLLFFLKALQKQKGRVETKIVRDPKVPERSQALSAAMIAITRSRSQISVTSSDSRRK